MKPAVSIVCTTYNHERYIGDALESFLMQDADFDYEIVVHDDASTDQTPFIVRNYADRYPDRIKPILQAENLYSKKHSRLPYLRPLVSGRYVARCEGDDYWTDRCKLQKQFDFMEAHPYHSMCFHAVACVDVDRRPLGHVKGIYGTGSRDLSMAEVIHAGVVHVSAVFCRRAVYLEDPPAWVRHAMHGDYTSALRMRVSGRVFYIDEVMSHYRVGVENSLMTRLNNETREQKTNYLKNRIETLQLANVYYDLKFREAIEKSVLHSKTSICIINMQLERKSRAIYRNFIRHYGFIRFLKLIMVNKFCGFVLAVSKFRTVISKKIN